ncbi:MAG: hypothetical protein GYB25_05360 [Rhodobacteraceae bacterium]|nr:hypothetical protein [Paracoccaceae bacterium]
MKRTLTALAALTVLATQASAMIHTDADTTARDSAYGVVTEGQSGNIASIAVNGYLTGEDRSQIGTATITVSQFDGTETYETLRR